MDLVTRTPQVTSNRGPPWARQRNNQFVLRFAGWPMMARHCILAGALLQANNKGAVLSAQLLFALWEAQ